MPRVLAIFLACLFGIGAAPLPALTGRVVDDAGVIIPLTRAIISAKLKDLEERSGIQVAVATVPSLDGEAIEPYATRLFNSWKLGRRGANDGTLILVAPFERRVRIEVGPGLADRIPDAVAARIIADDMLPLFRAGNIEGGIAAGVDRVVALVSPPLVLPAPAPPTIVQPAAPTTYPVASLPVEPGRSSDSGAVLLVCVFIVSFAVVMLILFLLVRRGGRSGSTMVSGTNAGWQPSGAGPWPSSDAGPSPPAASSPSSGGSFSGGGGTSDGGGATGSW